MSDREYERPLLLWKRCTLLSCIGLFLCHVCTAQDVFHVKRAIPPTPAAPQLGSTPCVFGPVPEPLILQEAVARALCTNPKSREAWVNIQIQADALGIALAAYLPTLSGTWQETYEDTSTVIPSYPQYNSAFSVFAGSGSANLNWTLYDFGGRKATVRGAKALLRAASSTAAATLQDVFATTAGHYLALQAALAKQDAATRNEALTAESLRITRERVDHGASPISDSLQAETSYLQAVVNRQQAAGATAGAQGSLAYDVGLRPDRTLVLPVASEPDPAALQQLEEAASTLLDAALQQQPAIAAAREQLVAAQTKITQVRAAGLPSFSMIGRISRSEQPASISLGVPPFLSTVKDSYIGVQVNLPVFEGFSRAYQIQQARAQATLQQEQLRDTERQVELDTWTALQAEKTALQSAISTQTLMDVAQRSYTVAQERYRLGVGGIIDLLTAQTALQAAREQSTAAVSTWDASRFTLSSKIGRLNYAELRKSAP